jgi:3-deoxy-manno-octulosonate cytidylyltransferase (CMP-KDO synthetase)
MKPECVAIIPARLASTRLPGKVLIDIHGKPMLWHVWQRVCQARHIAAVYVATDSPEVQEAVKQWGGNALMTSPACCSGTERIASIIDTIAGDFVINVQGDEPLIAPAMLDKMIEYWHTMVCDLITPIYRITNLDDLQNPNIVKVARAANGRALYFSRSPIPHTRDYPQAHWLDRTAYWGHVGVYGYSRTILQEYPTLPEGALEVVEKLEQLRLLESGYHIQTIETNYHPVAIDTEADLQRVRALWHHV